MTPTTNAFVAAATILSVWLVLVAPASAHSVLLCPTPRSTNAGEKAYPCGYNFFSDFDAPAPWTTVAPGPLTISWKETLVHAGAPWRIALSVGGDCGFEQVVLRDHIPHDDSASAGQVYYFTVDIPNVDCTATPCTLQLMSVMTDKIGGGTCDEVGNVASPSCFSVYHSCANIRITGTVPPATFLASYTYTPPAGWLNPVPNVWAAGESGTWSAGWLQGESTVVQGAACTTSPPPPSLGSYPTTCAACGYPASCGSPAPPTPPGPPPPSSSGAPGPTTSPGASPAGSGGGSTGGMSDVGFGFVITLVVVVVVAAAAAAAVFVLRARPSPPPSSAAPPPSYDNAVTKPVDATADPKPRF